MMRLAMEAVIKTPLDYQETLVFRRLSEWFSQDSPDVIRASYVYNATFRDLAYMAREGRDPGRVTPEDVSLFHKILARTTDRVSELWDSMVGKGEQPIRLFIPDGPDFICRPFADKNSHLVPGFQSKESLGGHMKSHNKLVSHCKTMEFQMSLNIGSDVMKDAAGEPLPAEMIRRVKWFIPAMDSALALPSRSAGDFSWDIVQNAVGILGKYADAQVELVCRYILRNRENPAVKGRQTEELLVIFDEIVQTMGATK